MCQFVVHYNTAKIWSWFGTRPGYPKQGAVQSRDHWIEISHIDFTTYFQLSEMERLR